MSSAITITSVSPFPFSANTRTGKPSESYSTVTSVSANDTAVIVRLSPETMSTSSKTPLIFNVIGSLSSYTSISAMGLTTIGASPMLPIVSTNVSATDIPDKSDATIIISISPTKFSVG